MWPTGPGMPHVQPPGAKNPASSKRSHTAAPAPRATRIRGVACSPATLVTLAGAAAFGVESTTPEGSGLTQVGPVTGARRRPSAFASGDQLSINDGLTRGTFLAPHTTC